MNSRSPRFPFIPLDEAVDLLGKLSIAHSDPVSPLPRPVLLDAFGYASLHGAATKTVAALRAYDLLEKAGDGVRISLVGRRILDADSLEEKRDFLQRAALSPLTFRMMWRRARHSSRSEWKELLLERGFTEPGAKRASKIYRKNDDLAGLRDLHLEPELPERGKRQEPCHSPRQGLGGNQAKTPGQFPRLNPNSLTIPLSTGAAIIPKGITEVEYTNLLQTLRTWKEQLVRKPKEEA